MPHGLSDILILNRLPVFPKYASACQCVLVFGFKKKKMVSMLRGVTRYVEILYFYSLCICEPTSFPTETVLIYPVPIFFLGSMDANVMWLQNNLK